MLILALKIFCSAISVTALSGLCYYIKVRITRKRRRALFPKNKVILHQFPRGLHAPSASPFVMKLETWLRMAGVPYQVN